MDRGAWWAVIHGIPKESDTTEELNNNNTGLIIQKLSTSQFSFPASLTLNFTFSNNEIFQNICVSTKIWYKTDAFLFLLLLLSPTSAHVGLESKDHLPAFEDSFFFFF